MLLNEKPKGNLKRLESLERNPTGASDELEQAGAHLFGVALNHAPEPRHLHTLTTRE
jgi:hypothetical protein